ncbi:MAG: relaxase/mobilization nuclease domain-containing protein [Treponematales bacterium]
MIAKAKAISHGRQAINYVLREGKLGAMLASNLIESLTPDEILKEFEMMQRYNTRSKNKFLRFEIGIAPQDEAKLKRADLQIICRQFAKSMGLTDNQWFACTHKDTDNLHIHLIANRINIDGAVYQTDFVSNRAAKAAEELSRKMGLTIANEVRKQKQHEKQQMSPERYEIKKRLQDIAYKEFRNPNNKTAKSFIEALKRQGVMVEPVRNKQNKIYGIRFQFEGQTFKASEIGKEFGLRSLFLHYGQNIDGSTAVPKHFEKTQASPLHEQSQSTTNIIGGLLDLPLSTSDYDAEEAALQRQTMKKKKKRRGMRM